jgi:hypothetical protein
MAATLTPVEDVTEVTENDLPVELDNLDDGTDEVTEDGVSASGQSDAADATEAALKEIEDIFLEIGAEDVEVDRVKLDKKFQADCKTGEKTYNQLLVLMHDTVKAEIHLDPKVLDENGNQFPTWAKWFADRTKNFPGMGKALTAKYAKELLANDASIRDIVKATGMSRGWVMNRKKEVEGEPSYHEIAKGKKEAEKAANDAVVAEAKKLLADAEAEAKADAEELESGSTVGATKAFEAGVAAVAKVMDVIAQLSPEQRDKWRDVLQKADKATGVYNGIVEHNEAVNEQAEKNAA